MVKDTAIQKSLVEQIFDEILIILEKRDEFDAHTIQRIKALAISGNLNKVKKVAESIKSTPERTL